MITITAKEQEKYISKLILNNNTVQNILKNIRSQGEELYLGGGVIRNIVWDDLHGYKAMTPFEDIDVVYYDNENISESYDNIIQKKLYARMPNFKWSVKNQARMHAINGDEPYNSLTDAVSKWPETVSAILVRERQDGEYSFIAPFGYDDVFRLIVQPTPHFLNKIEKYRLRVSRHDWQRKWSKLKILYMDKVDTEVQNS